jgi:HPt (histidine-containing phosphotransfer) domain-containing protein
VREETGVTVIDPDIAGHLAASLSRRDFVRILRTFEADLGRLAAEYGRATEASDEEAQRRAAHSLAGAAAGIGAAQLEAAARRALAAEGSTLPHDLARDIGEAATAARAELAALADRAQGGH